MKEISPMNVEQKLAANEELHLIDVRETAEVREGVIPGAIHIPLGLIEFRMDELDKSQEYVIVCRSGNRSGLAARILEGYGFKVINMNGGMLSWNGPVQ